MSQVVKNGPASYIVPGCVILEPRRARYMSFWSSNCQHKVRIGPDLAGTWAVPNLAQLFLINQWTDFIQIFQGSGMLRNCSL